MAISEIHYKLLKSLANELPQGGTLLEIGEANFYGDMNPAQVEADILEKQPGEWQDELLAEYRECTNAPQLDLFRFAKLMYDVVFAPASVMSVDMSGTEKALKHDLNYTLRLPHKCDVSMNHGTAEHVFNAPQVFKSMHDWTNVGGVMIHESPFTGWVDHGFWSMQPTLFYDLAAANSYEILLVAIQHLKSASALLIQSRSDVHILDRRDQLPGDTMLYVAYRKVREGEFALPIQGVYAAGASEELKRDWQERR